ncbi:MAG: aldo/keto reductase [Acidobacteriaceae bacterium]
MKMISGDLARDSRQRATLNQHRCDPNRPGAATWRAVGPPGAPPAPGEGLMLGFGCAAMMGRVGRKDSLASLGAAYDAGIQFFDVARSYGYGEAEMLLGEFLRGRRASVLIGTKFGILPGSSGLFSAIRRLKPVVRGLLRLAPGARRLLQEQLAAQTSGGHFRVEDLHASLEASLRALQTDYVDILFLHEPPASVMERDDLFAALEALVAEGKVRWLGVAATPEVIEATDEVRTTGVHYLQFPCNLANLGRAQRVVARVGGEGRVIANHPFGGAGGVAAGRALLNSLACAAETPQAIREKLKPVDDGLLADVVLNLVTSGLGVSMVVASMLNLEHLRANLAALRQSRFSAEELVWLREAVLSIRASVREGSDEA